MTKPSTITKLTNAYYRRAQELANTVNVGNGARLKVTKTVRWTGGPTFVNLQIVNTADPTQQRAHMLVQFITNNKGKPVVYLMSGKTTPEYRRPAAGTTGKNYGYGTIIRALAVKISENVKARKTKQTSVNTEALLPYGQMPISGRIMQKLGAKLTEVNRSGTWYNFQIRHGRGIHKKSFSKSVLRGKKVHVPNLPPNVNYNKQMQKLEQGLRLWYSTAGVNYNTARLPLNGLHRTMNSTLNMMKLEELKTKINVMKRRIPNRNKLYTMKELVNHYASQVKQFQRSRTAALTKLKQRLALRLAKPRVRAPTITVPQRPLITNNIPTSVRNMIAAARSKGIPNAEIGNKVITRFGPFKNMPNSVKANVRSLYTNKQWANRGGLYYNNNNA